MPYIKAEEYHEMCGDLYKKNVIILELKRELERYKKLYFGSIQEQEEQEKWICELKEINVKMKDSVKFYKDCYKELSCNCFKHGKEKCCKELNCEKCGKCMMWRGFEEGSKYCSLECKRITEIFGKNVNSKK